MIQMTLVVDIELEVKVPVGIEFVIFVEVWVLVRIKASFEEEDLVGNSSDQAFIVKINALAKALTNHLFNAHIGVLTTLKIISIPLRKTLLTGVNLPPLHVCLYGYALTVSIQAVYFIAQLIVEVTNREVDA